MIESHPESDGATSESEIAKLRDRIDSGALGTTRQEIGALVARDRAACLRLLDLLLADEGRLEGRLRAIEALVTALSMDPTRRGGRVACSPSQLTPELAGLARRLGAARPRALADAALQLSRAAASHAEGPLRIEVKHAIEALKARLGTDLLAATVLDAVIEYNLVMGNAATGDQALHASDSVVAPAAEATRATTAPAVRAGREPESPAPAPAGSTQAHVECGSATAAPRDWPVLDTPPGSRPAASRLDDDVDARAPRRWRVAVLAAAAMIVGFTLTQSGGATLQAFSPAELQALSPLLASGYRDHGGVGPFFVGRFAPKWLGLQPEIRDAVARDLVARLARQGVRRAMVYDPELRLVVGFAGGDLRTFGNETPAAPVPAPRQALRTRRFRAVATAFARIPRA